MVNSLTSSIYTLLLTVPLLLATAMCGDNGDGTDNLTSGGTGGAAGSGGSGGAGGAEPQTNVCDDLSLAKRAYENTEPASQADGTLRNELARDFSLPMVGGEIWSLSESWTGCDAYVFLTNNRTVSALDGASLWERDIENLVALSPPNAHYFFVASREAADAQAELTAMQARIDAALADDGVRAWWTPRLHVVGTHASELEGWVGAVLGGVGRAGFAIDRAQRIRTLGNFADVTRFKQALNSAGEWPWESNLAYATYEVRHFNYEAKRSERLDAEDATIITAWDGEVLAEQVETAVMFPSESDMTTFDTLEIDLTMQCPDMEAGEFGNCGAWDYLAHIYMQDERQMTWTELGRFISTYHRQGRYVVDATALLPMLKSGGLQRIRYNVSPPWNPQAYSTHMHFRLSNRGKGYRPTSSTKLFEGGNFNGAYNDRYEPIDVPIPSDAQRVELWAVITGHGGATSNCAEFCNHQHEFTINDQPHFRDHPTVGQDQGCLNEVDNGVVPNQGGTWWFGRGGWCPGQQVEPWVVDVTAEVTPGTTATVSYRGLLNGGTPPDDAGNIIMQSYLVIYQ